MKLLHLFLLFTLSSFLFIACSDNEEPTPVKPEETTEIKTVTDKLEKIGEVSDFASALKAAMSELNIPDEKLTVLAVSDDSKKTEGGKFSNEVLKRHIVKGIQDLEKFTTDTLFLSSISGDNLQVTKKNGKIYVNNSLLKYRFPTKEDESAIYVISEIIPQLEGLKLPSNLRDGITILSPDSLAFVLFAPGKESVHLIGDFNNWTTSYDYKMKKDGDRFWIKIGGLQKGKEYICQYLIDDKIKIADPYASKISDPWNDKNISSTIYPNLISYPTGKTDEIAMIVNTAPAKYSWNISNFKSPSKESLVIYEVLIRDFTEKRSIKGVQEKLDYIKNLGVNAIELMPFNEFEGNDSWGYNPSFYFATDKAYGTASDYKAFIDACHAKGIAVIMDMVLNHSFHQSPLVRMYQDASGNPTAENPWYNQKGNFANPDAQWGADFNHESEHTKALVDSICSYWMKEYKIDGFRFDFTKGFSNTPYPATGDIWGSSYDAARIKNLNRMYDEIKKRNSEAIVIFEHLTDNDEEKELADQGILLWGKMTENFNEATMGWGAETEGYGPKGDVSWGSYKERGWSKPSLITYMESHDEERIMFKNNSYGKAEGSYDVKKLTTGLERTEAAAVIMMSIPGPKMIWQFGELGYDISIDYNGRTGMKPIYWSYYDVPERKALYDVYAAMNKIRTSNPIFSTSDYTIDLKNQFKQILLKSGSGNICAIANFDVVPLSATVKFGKTGKWSEYFTKNEITLSTSEQIIELKPGEYRLYISK